MEQNWSNISEKLRYKAIPKFTMSLMYTNKVLIKSCPFLDGSEALKLLLLLPLAAPIPAEAAEAPLCRVIQ